jgi:hypothetical protein
MNWGGGEMGNDPTLPNLGHVGQEKALSLISILQNGWKGEYRSQIPRPVTGDRSIPVEFLFSKK